MKPAIARREFLLRAGKAFGALGLSSAIYDTILAHFFQQAFAQTLGTGLNPSGYYVHLTMPGGPPRWLFDLPLTPAGLTANNFVQGGFGTRFEKVGGEFKSVYRVDRHTAAGKTLYLPPVWSMNLAKQNFAKDVLPHTTFIRGLDMEINNHGLSNSRQVAPIIGGLSLQGVVADEAQRPMPGVVDASSSAGQGFRSKKGLAANPITLTAANPVADVLRPFQNYMAGRGVHSPAANKLTEQAFAQFEKYATDRGLASSALPEIYDSSMALIEKNIYALSSKWAAALAKYRAIVDEAIHPAKGTLPGIFDQTIPSKNDGTFRYDQRTDTVVNHGDIRNMVSGSLTAPRLAEGFAATEILLDEVTASATISMLALNGVQSGKGLFNMTHDQHRHGVMMSTMMTTLFYRAVLGCLSEFVAALKEKKIFERTVIHISAEFNRTPLATGFGSDHGFMGSNTTLISGMVTAPSCFGNIQKASYNNTYTGTFGVAKPFLTDGFTRPIQVNDVARTITAMLGVDDIVTNGRTLLVPSGKVWVPKKNEANNV